MFSINEFLGQPENASEHGAMVDHGLELVHWFMAVLGVGWGLFFLYCLYRFHRSRQPKADYYGVQNHASSHLEIGVVIVEVVLLVGMAFPLWAQRVSDYPTGDKVVRVRAVSEQFKWTMHYPGQDGRFGLADAALITTDNPLGINWDDPNAKDDFLSPVLVLAKDRDTIIRVLSKDVIHNLHLVPMRIAQDAIPGSPADMTFKPIKTGTWQTICGQLCGAGHAQMVGQMEVMEEEDYDAWFESKSPLPEADPKLTGGEENKTASL
ncbi:MAG: hypothetical protein AAGA58_04970 [Verrucomicrobiota bacterium]